MWNHVSNVLNQALDRTINAAVNFLPGLLALGIILALATVLAFILRAMMRRSLSSIQFDRHVVEWGFGGLAEWSPGRSPSQFVAQIAFWTMVGIGLLVGISALDARITSLMVVRLVDYLPNVAAAIVVMVVGVILARFFARSVLISAVNMNLQSARLLSLGVKWLVMVLAGAMALGHLGIGGQIVQVSFGILFGGIVLAMALAVGLGSKEMVSRSWERQTDREREVEEHFHHL
jgi:hypothetical protein